MIETIDQRAHCLTRAKAVDLPREMWGVRFSEERGYDMLGKNLINGASHLAGDEAAALGAISTLRHDDLVKSAHRGQVHCHAHDASLCTTDEARQEHLNKMLAELSGRATDYFLGRGGTIHVADAEKGNLGAIGIVGGNITVATGAGLAQNLQNDDRGVMCLFGDGASNAGKFHESLILPRCGSCPPCTSSRITCMACPSRSRSRPLN
jgi:TPP-dependent pyruvate/acetoin dehydrogenase alpha subunit